MAHGRNGEPGTMDGYDAACEEITRLSKEITRLSKQNATMLEALEAVYPALRYTQDVDCDLCCPAALIWHRMGDHAHEVVLSAITDATRTEDRSD